MIIDSHEHIFSDAKKQIELIDKAGVDKTILFSTTFHPENCSNASEIENESQIYLDLSAVFSTFQIKAAVWQLPEKCLFSSDAPMGDPLIYRFMLEKTISDKSVLKQVLGENIECILNI